jgi:hypothetical protein
MVKRMAATFARFIGLASVMYGGSIFIGHLLAALNGAVYDPGWSLPLIMAFGGAGALGGLIYLLSFDGPTQWRTRNRRLLGWSGMLVCALLPSYLMFFMAPLVLIGLFTVFLPTDPDQQPRGRHLVTSG